MNRPTIHTVELYPGAPERHEVVLLRDYEALHRKLDNAQQAVPLSNAKQVLNEQAAPVAVPDGYQMVPKKITPEMIESALSAHYGARRVRQAGGPGGVDMTANGINYSGIHAMRRMYAGALSAAPTPPAQQSHVSQVDDLAALVGKLVQALRKVSPGVPIAAQAVDYLKRKRLMNPLRQQSGRPELIESVARAIYEQWIGQPGYVSWVEHGNSLMQGQARSIARAAIDTAAPEQAEQDAIRGPELTPDLAEILGRPNFMCADLAHLLRQSGQQIGKKAEAEQAVVIHWLLGFYLQHGSAWKEKVGEEIKRLSEKARARLEGGE